MRQPPHEPIQRQALLAAALPIVVLLLFSLVLGTLWWALLEGAERSGFEQQLGERAALVLLLVVVCGGALGHGLHGLHRRWVLQPAQLAEQANALLRMGGPPLLAAPEQAALVQVINELAQQRDELATAIDNKVRQASRVIDEERQRLAALMSELQHSVVVCNLDGRILLYNRRARLQFRALSDAPQTVAGAELIGIGRSIHAVLDRYLVAHALDGLAQRSQRGVAHPATQFVTHTRGGQLLRVQIAAFGAGLPGAGAGVDEAGSAGSSGSAASTALAGYVLMLDNITREYAEESERDQRLHAFTEAARGTLGSLQAAVELLADDTLDGAMRAQLQAVVADETAVMSQRVRELAEQVARSSRTRWPLEHMHGPDLLLAARRRIAEEVGCAVDAVDVDPQLWLRADSYSLLRVLCHLAGLLHHERRVNALTLRLQAVDAGGAAGAAGAAGDSVQLDLLWPSTDAVKKLDTAWTHEPIRVGGCTSALSVHDVVQRHGGALWLEQDVAHGRTLLRFVLPSHHGEVAVGAEAASNAGAPPAGGRPEFYDFDLLAHMGSQAVAASGLQTPLAELAYTVFDTETTGLNPGEGDEIIQLGATRIVAGKLRRQECFDQLVDPRRGISAASIEVHGIQPEMLRGQPDIQAVLPAFHAFAADTVLVAHNAAFDMRFLELKQVATGICFEQPVLDTLLLSAVAQPQQTSHSLEAIATRLGVPMLGRHTALGDALVTAEVFLKLLPLLQAQGVHTLGEALEASRKTWAAGLKY